MQNTLVSFAMQCALKENLAQLKDNKSEGDGEGCEYVQGQSMAELFGANKMERTEIT